MAYVEDSMVSISNSLAHGDAIPQLIVTTLRGERRDHLIEHAAGGQGCDARCPRVAFRVDGQQRHHHAGLFDGEHAGVERAWWVVDGRHAKLDKGRRAIRQ